MLCLHGTLVVSLDEKEKNRREAINFLRASVWKGVHLVQSVMQIRFEAGLQIDVTEFACLMNRLNPSSESAF